MVWTPIRYKTLQFRVDAARLLFVTEIAPKSPSLCVNISPIRYDFSFWHSDFELQAKSANEHFSYVLVNQIQKAMYLSILK